MHAISVRDLTVRYPGLVALQGVNLEVKKGDFLGIIGPNGAGKSTLFDVMLGLNTSYKGTVEFFGSDIRKSRDYLFRVGYVPQNPTFEKNFPATVRDVVGMGLRKGDNAAVEAVLKQLWIHELANRRIGRLSGGQLQRVFIAKALVGKPDILILDEPVAGVDAQSTELFYSILRSLHSGGLTIVWSSHDLDAVRRLAGSVACMNCTLSYHGGSDRFFADEALVKQYSESSMQEHMEEEHKNVS